MAIKCYFDGSGKVSDPSARYVTLAGVAATDETWHVFENAWRKVLSDFGISSLHMKNLMNFRGAFTGDVGWNVDRVDQLLYAVRLAIQESTADNRFDGEGSVIKVQRLSCTVEVAAYQRAEARLRPDKDIYAACVDGTLPRLVVPPGEKAHLYFDQGELFRSKVQRAWEQLNKRKHRGWNAQTDEISTARSVQCLPLQLADYIAWVTNRHHSVGDREGLWELMNLQLMTSPHIFFDYDRLLKSHLVVISHEP